MSVSSAVRMALAKGKKKQVELAAFLGIQRQPVNLKLAKERWTGAELARIASFTGGKLAFIYPDGEQILIEAPEKETEKAPEKEAETEPPPAQPEETLSPEKPREESSRPYRVIIAGSRDFSDYPALCAFADRFLAGRANVEIVSGGARGADTLGERYARERGYALKRFPADWERLGRSAGVIRNGEMAQYADALLAFWDGRSSGTRDMIRRAMNAGLTLQVYTCGE